jgi:dihydrofolate reductase
VSAAQNGRMAERKIIVYIAVSADGYIARPDGSVDWLDRPHPEGSYGMNDFFASIDTILWGRKTYDMAVNMPDAPSFGPRVKNYVFSHHPDEKPMAGYEFVKEPIPEFAKELRARPGKNIWMMGGAGLIGSFLDEGEIDEFSIHVIPVLIGEGIPLIAPRHRNVQLELLSAPVFSDGVVHLNYRVKR